MRKFSTFVFVAVLGVLVMPGTAWAVAFGISPTTGPPGTSIGATGGATAETACVGTAVNLALEPVGSDEAIATTSATPDSNGLWTTGQTPLVVPNNAGPGAYEVTADCVGDDTVYDPQAFTVEPPATIRTALPAVVRGNTWFMRNTLTTGAANASFIYGDPGDEPIICDWDGNGVATVGVRRGFTFYLRNTNSAGVADLTIPFGNVGDVATCGDWDDDGDEEVGVVRGNQWFLRMNNTPGDPATHPAFFYGDPGDQPKVGDWDGNGSATPGVRRGNVWYLKNNLSSGPATLPPMTFGDPGDVPLVGDWNDNGTETMGVFRAGQWFFKNTLSSGVADTSIFYGSPGDRPRVWFSED